MKPCFSDFLHWIVFWKRAPGRFAFGTVEAACTFIPAAEKMATIHFYQEKE